MLLKIPCQNGCIANSVKQDSYCYCQHDLDLDYRKAILLKVNNNSK